MIFCQILMMNKILCTDRSNKKPIRAIFIIYALNVFPHKTKKFENNYFTKY